MKYLSFFIPWDVKDFSVCPHVKSILHLLNSPDLTLSLHNHSSLFLLLHSPSLAILYFPLSSAQVLQTDSCVFFYWDNLSHVKSSYCPLLHFSQQHYVFCSFLYFLCVRGRLVSIYSFFALVRAQA